MASWTALAVVSGVLVTYAVNADGYPVHKAELNDGGVWVTNQSMGAVGRQNVPVAQIDGRVFDGADYTSNPNLDVLQDGSAVISFNRASNSLLPIDAAMATGLDEQAVTAAGSATLFGGGSLGALDHSTGKLWATTVDPDTGTAQLTGVTKDAKPVATVGGNAVGAAGTDGTLYAASGDDGKVVALRRAADTFEKPEVDDLSADHEGDLAAMTVVGQTPVMVDDKGNLLTRSDSLGNVGAGAEVQQAGPESDDVLVATRDALVAVAVDGGGTHEVAKVGAQASAAAPVEMANGCAFAAWGSGQTGTLVTACGDAKASVNTFDIKDGAELVFRVNRNEIVLNDEKSGMTWTVTDSEPELISNWEAFRQETSKKDDSKAHKTEAKTTQPPQAKTDELGARDGRTTVLNVLDNDLIASDGILSIVDVKGVTRDDVHVRIAPDRQSLLATVDPGASGIANFRYTISDGTGKKTSQADGDVKLTLRSDNGSGKPKLRENAEAHSYPVAAGGVVEFAVTPDWRDKDYGDPVIVQSVKASGDLDVSTTALGLIRAEARPGSKGGIQTVSYTVTTGGTPSSGSVKVEVVPAGTRTEPAKAEPDVVSGEVNGPITVKPLDNDIPGADGSDAGAKLALAGRVTPTGGLDVDTDLESGEVTVTGSRPGTYFLDYRAGFGAAARADGKIRVDITPQTPEGNRPVATPDVSAVHGLSPVTIDVLANDFDPRGRMLVVQNAQPSSPDSQLEVAVIDGRWLRVNAIDGAMSPKSQSVTYTISNGDATAEGSVNVTQRDALSGAENAPIAQTDRITVRAGDTAAAPVLDNDATPSGDPVGLVLDASVEPIGELRVLPKVGTAYVSGRQVRYVAPADVTGPTDVDVQYVVENTGDPTAETAIGTLKVHITPAPSAKNPDLAPTPRALEGRVVQGDLVTLKLPPTGSDPDGDSVAVTGVATAPKFGRILAFGANSLTYQAYPDATGTDDFTYEVTDPFGESAIGHARVGVVQAGEPQAPVAVNDSWLADPARTVDVDALGNDLRTPGTRVDILPLDDTGTDVKLQSDQGPVSVHAPEDGKTRNVTYTITNGLAESRGVVSIEGRKGYNNPPITRDLFATPKAGADTVDVNVLAAVFDVDGPEDKLKLDQVSGIGESQDGDQPAIHGGKVSIPVKDVAQVLAYRVLDDEGAAAAGAIYVPAKPTGTPFLKPGASIEMKPGSTKDVDLSDLVEDPEGDPVVLTTVDGIGASPAERLTATGKDKDALELTATKSEGPGSVVFEVSDRAKLTDPEAHTAFISVPVQVGDLKPVINCPSMPIDVPEGGVSKSIDIASVCHVWTSDPRQARELSFTADWKQEVKGVDVSTDGGRVQLEASGDAHRGDTGVIAVGAKGYAATGKLLVRVVALPAPKLAPIHLDTEAGKPVTVNVEQYLSSPLPSSSRKVKVMSVSAEGGASAKSSIEGTKVTFTPLPDTSGVMRYRLAVSDVDGSTSSGRPQATGEVELAVVARPSAPTGLVAGQEMLANTVALNWRTPDNNGKRIDGYEVQYSGPSSGTFHCSGSPCRVTGLKNGDEYTFKVRAHNATQQNGGWSEWSNTAKATPDALTGPPLDPTVVRQRDNALTVKWSKPAPCDCSDVQKYRVSWPGGVADVSASTLEKTVSAPNGDVITVKIMALNKKGIQTNSGPSTSVTGTGAGKPAAPGAPSLSPTNRPGNASKAINVSWAPVGANGPGPVSYQVQRSSGSGTTIVCTWTTATSCNDEVTNDGTVYSYQVQAKNAEADSPREPSAADKANHISGWGSAQQIEASAPPAAPAITSLKPTGQDGTATITFNVGASHGKSNTVTCQSSSGACGTWTFPNAGQSGVTRTISGLPDGSTTTVTLSECNGGSANMCATSNSAQVVTYGPIGGVSINATPDSPAAGDRTTNWSISVDPNGAPVHWVVRSSVNGVIAQGDSGNGAFNKSGGETLGYSTNVTYTLTVTDASGHGRAGKSASDGARTGANPPPPLNVSVSKGASCSGSGCPGAQSACAATCWWIDVTTSGFSGGVSCDLHNVSDGSVWWSWSQGGNATANSGAWNGKTNGFYATCSRSGESARSGNAW
ncbi:Ig-like domain-containing protein [Nocardioides jejuensis]|uniref:Fibronectin type III domain-containing protein n=1 Tax=Nocardioides jejuensis TaxID=2502782 RepID=A0A4R1CJL2_9ACTN|nr:Ig-like domain-containing protein [Nocardioides jejuensis]TCJ30188.1 fibronectin type III domain-containing protein [Nocardioides jejuensis]